MIVIMKRSIKRLPKRTQEELAVLQELILQYLVNVPVGESIQMFTALKLLGRETAFVAVTGQDHHIVDYGSCQCQ